MRKAPLPLGGRGATHHFAARSILYALDMIIFRSITGLRISEQLLQRFLGDRLLLQLLFQLKNPGTKAVYEYDLKDSVSDRSCGNMQTYLFFCPFLLRIKCILHLHGLPPRSFLLNFYQNQLHRRFFAFFF